ncbi:glycine zipper 2TM domain-containing protein [Roseomonas sp. BN140053]|uniref:glycine zipper 2TM domain-containing protein n=1 Tax=Roseomonas sp. BN140053 TaxID=3391898 RepID=UPI0039EA62CB
MATTPATPSPRRFGRFRSLAVPLALPLALGAGLAGCAPQNTGTTYSSAALGRAASVSYGTIKGLRPVTVQGNGAGVGAVGGAVAGGLAGSFIGGDPRSNIIAGLGGALLGGLAGSAIGNAASTGQAVEFFIGEDYGTDISVVQTNEEGLQVGDRVVISRGDRTRISRAAGGPPPAALGAAPGYAPSGAAPSGYASPTGAYSPK